jgi:hypothetical protein
MNFYTAAPPHTSAKRKGLPFYFLGSFRVIMFQKRNKICSKGFSKYRCCMEDSKNKLNSLEQLRSGFEKPKLTVHVDLGLRADLKTP